MGPQKIQWTNLKEKIHDEADSNPIDLGGNFTFPGTSMTVKRMGYGAMQLAGPGEWGPPRDPGRRVAVLRDAVEAGVNHIDTSDFYGPHVTNQIIRRRSILTRKAWYRHESGGSPGRR